MTQVLPSAPTPTLPARCRRKLPKQWAISWHSSCKRQNSAEKPDRNGNFLSGNFLPFPMLSYCGSGCGSGLTHTLTHRLNPQKRKEKVLFSEENRTFWSCWADSNRRPHPYQKAMDAFVSCPFMPIKVLQSLVLQGLEGFLLLRSFTGYQFGLCGFSLFVGRTVGKQSMTDDVSLSF